MSNPFVLYASPEGEFMRYAPAMNYMLHCEGCHQNDGSGQPGYIPAFAGTVAQFVKTVEGRSYLARVPGVSGSLLQDDERAALLNWILKRFDADNLPLNFTPYTEQELARWRHDSLSQPLRVRAQLLARMESDIPSLPVEPPAAFTLCAACHTYSADAANGMGPNLYGIVGRSVGTRSGYTYSGAMQAAGFTWTPERLDEFLKSPSESIPGNFMAMGAIQSAEDRAAIIGFLTTLR